MAIAAAVLVVAAGEAVDLAVNNSATAKGRSSRLRGEKIGFGGRC